MLVYFFHTALFSRKMLDFDRHIRFGLISQTICNDMDSLVYENETSRFKLYTMINNYIESNITSGLMIMMFLLVILGGISVGCAPPELRYTLIVILVCLFVFAMITTIVYVEFVKRDKKVKSGGSGTLFKALDEYNEHMETLLATVYSTDSLLGKKRNKNEYNISQDITKAPNYSDEAVYKLKQVLIDRIMHAENYSSRIEAKGRLEYLASRPKETRLQLIGYTMFDKDSVDYQYLNEWVCKSNGCTAYNEMLMIPTETWKQITLKLEKLNYNATPDPTAAAAEQLELTAIKDMLKSDAMYSNFKRYLQDTFNADTTVKKARVKALTESYNHKDSIDLRRNKTLNAMMCCEASQVEGDGAKVADAIQWLSAKENTNITKSLSKQFEGVFALIVLAFVVVMYPLFHILYKSNDVSSILYSVIFIIVVCIGMLAL